MTDAWLNSAGLNTAALNSAGLIDAWRAGVWAAATRGGAALGVAWAASLFPRVPAAVRCWAWRAAYGVLLVAFAWTAPVDVAVRRAVPAVPAAAVPALAGRPGALAGATVLPGDAAASRPRPGRTAAPTPTPVWPAVAFFSWLGFVAAYTVRLAAGWTAARRFRGGRPVDAPELAGLCRTVGVRRPPAVRAHPAARGPLLVGVWDPVVVLPDPPPPPADRRLVLAHELAHLRRRDLLWNWLPAVAVAVLPWHPLVWLAGRRWRLATEAACDAAAVAATAAEVADYGRLIVSVATPPARPTSGVLAVAAAAGSRWLLKERLAAMANTTRWNRRRLVAAGTVVGVAGLAAAVPWRAVAQQPPATRPEVAVGRHPDGQPATVAATIGPAASPPVVLLGTVVATEATVRSAARGTVDQVTASAGQAVHRGDVLVRLDTTAADAAVKGAEAETAYEVADVARRQAQYRTGNAGTGDVALAEAQVEVARAKLAVLRHDVDALRLLAPFDGVVERVDVQPGDVVEFHQAMATVLKAGPPQVECELPEAFVGRVGPGTPVVVGRAAQAGVAGQVVAVAPVLDPQTRSQRVTARLSVEQPGLLPGMDVQVAVDPAAVAERPPGPADAFPVAIAFERLDNHFAAGDQITVTDVRSDGGNPAVWRITGTYTLASHRTATLAASVTARDAAHGVGPWRPAQHVEVGRGQGTFSLQLPVGTGGFPHVSFYDDKGSFGGLYVGTGDSVLRR